MPDDAGSRTHESAEVLASSASRSAAIAFAVALAVAVVALDMREFLNAPAIDGLAGVEVAFRVEHTAVQERELAVLKSRRAKLGEDLAQRAVEDVQDLVPSVGLEKVSLRGVVAEREIPRRTRGAESRYAANSECHAGSRNDRDDPLQHTGLGEDLDAVIRAIAHVHQPVVADGDAMRMATIARGKQAGRVGHEVHRPRHSA